MPFSKSTAPIYPKIDETSLATNYVLGGVIILSTSMVKGSQKVLENLKKFLQSVSQYIPVYYM